jgi:hypothetical protein
MAQNRHSAAARFRSAYRRLTDIPAAMSGPRGALRSRDHIDPLAGIVEALGAAKASGLDPAEVAAAFRLVAWPSVERGARAGPSIY